MEIGGYRELDLRKGNEFYNGQDDIARLNSGRAGIYHALRCLNCKKIFLPYYQCETVRQFLSYKNIKIFYYHIDDNFLPLINNELDDDTAVLIVNYFGLMKINNIKKFKEKYKNIIFDNTQAFYQKPIDGSYSVYSPRKFFGVADGCYLIGKNSHKYTDEYIQDSSSNSSQFLFKRIETGGNNNYVEYKLNEEKISNSNIMKMSKLTHALLDNIDYNFCKEKRIVNFKYAKNIFSDLNRINPSILDVNLSTIVPMVYPLVVEEVNLRNHLKENNIFVGQWWKYLLFEKEPSDIEKYFSKYLIPIQIDQRYGKYQIDYQYNIIKRFISNQR